MDSTKHVILTIRGPCRPYKLCDHFNQFIQLIHYTFGPARQRPGQQELIYDFILVKT